MFQMVPKLPQTLGLMQYELVKLTEGIMFSHCMTNTPRQRFNTVRI